MFTAVLAALGSIVAAYLLYLGARFQGNRAKEGAAATADVAAQDSALKAWEKLLQPYIDEVKRLREELLEERKDRAAKESTATDDRVREKKIVDDQLASQQSQIDQLRSEVQVWKRVAQTIARWATALRDEVLRLGGTVPATPEELLTLQAIKDREE